MEIGAPVVMKGVCGLLERVAPAVSSGGVRGKKRAFVLLLLSERIVLESDVIVVSVVPG